MKKFLLLTIVIAFAVISVIFITFLPQIVIDEDITRYIGEGDTELDIFNKVNESFDVNNVLLMALKWPEYWKELTSIAKITSEMGKLYGVKNVSSLTNSISFDSKANEIIVGSLESNYELDSIEPEQMKEIIETDKNLRQNFISDDNQSILFILDLEDSDSINVNNAMREIVDYLDGLEKEAYISGNPVTSFELAQLSGQDTFILIPVALALITIVLLFMFRTKTGLFLPLITVVIADVWTIGLMLVSGTRMSSVLLLIPIIMIGIGVDNAIYFISRYYEERHRGMTAKESVRQTYKDVGKPMILACVTTAAGLMSLLTASIIPVNQLGIFGSIEIGIILLISMVLIPALLLLLKPKARANLNEKGEMSFLKSVTAFVLAHKKITIAVIGVLSVLMLLQFPNLKAQVDLADFLSEDSIAVKGSDYLADAFGGDDQLFLYFKASGDEDNNLYQDFYYHRAMRDIQAFAENMEVFSSTRSISDTVADLSGAFSEYAHIPGSNIKMEQLFFLIQDDEALRQLMKMKTNESRAVLTGSFQENLNDIEEIGDPVEEFINNEIIKDYTVQYLDLADNQSLNAWRQSLGQFLKARSQILTEGFFSNFVGLKKADPSELFESMSLQELFERFNDFLAYYSMESITLEEFTAIKKGESEPGLYDDFVFQEEMPIRSQKALEIIQTHYPDMKRAYKEEFSAYIHDEQVPLAINSGQKGIHLEVEFTGSAFIMSGIQNKIVESQISSLIIAIFIVLLLFVIQMRSFLVGIISMLPLLLALLFNFGFIAGLGFSLNAATVTIASLMIGLGIDYAIHYLSRFRIELSLLHDKREAILRTSGTTGKGIFAAALTTFFSFFPLAFARASIMSQFGLIAAFNVMVTMILVFTLLPILLMMIPEEKILKGKQKKVKSAQEH